MESSDKDVSIYDSIKKRNYVEFGHLVARHRQSFQPVMSREVLAKKSKLSVRTLGDIERGEKEYLDIAIVGCLADALKLTGLAREEFFTTVGFLPDTKTLSFEEQELEERLTKHFYKTVNFQPAYIYDELYDVHSINSYTLALFKTSVEQLAEIVAEYGRLNILQRMFIPGIQEEPDWNDWQQIVEYNVYIFRAKSKRHSNTSQYHQLRTQLRKLPGFKEIWQKTSDPTFVPPYSPHLRKATLYANTPEQVTLLIGTTHMPQEFSKLIENLELIIYVATDEFGNQLLSRIRGEVEYKAYKIDKEKRKIEEINWDSH